MVVGRAGVTTHDDIQDTIEILQPARDRITGAVLTMSNGETV